MMRSVFIAISTALVLLLSSCSTVQTQENEPLTPAQILEMEDTYVPWWAR